ncbi:MAG: alginate export family protein [Endomicrobiales bacterium]|nr:alginate export family protein [Endomicrobiales bacterium]
MKKINIFSISLFFIIVFLFCAKLAVATTLNIDTEYRLRGVSYSETHFDQTASSVPLSYYSSRLKILIGATLPGNVEIGSEFCAIGVAGGGTKTVFAVPYQKTDFTPYVETVYLKIKNFNELPLDLTIGKQHLVFGDGLIISDDDRGFTALRVDGHFLAPLKWDGTLFTAKVSDNLKPDSDCDLLGLNINTLWREHLWELGYFEERDFSGSNYKRGLLATSTTEIIKNFIDFRIGKKEKLSNYQFELAKQSGYITKADGTKTDLDALGYVIRGELIGEKTKLGKVSAKALFSYATGNDDTNSLSSTDKAFTPDFTARYDGLERKGYGQLFGATAFDGFYTIPASFSGINTLSLGTDFSPVYALTFGVYYYLYSASQGPKGAPEASGFERLFNANYTLGVEMDLSMRYEYSKYCQFALSYARYTPPVFEALWPLSAPANRYQLEVIAKF